MIQPKVINKFNVYGDGTKYFGKGDEVTLPAIESVLATFNAGLGEVEMPVMGMLQKMEIEIPFVTLCAEGISAFAANRSVNLTLRASQQGEAADGSIGYQPIKAVVKGPCKKFDPGKIKAGESTGAKATIAVNYYSIDIDGTNVIEIDVLNDVYKVNGEDIMKDILANC